ncbi:hypothetical protein COUCH_09835 [Couchioplanes caeruleus]|uniref:hypothetical protein n=1 Tax=Couchioplanes caeruleus TaxID=56438 RepID=UPI0020C164D9|nr:hypothetical protein [Couchioplanes caeruleus]UQU66534.1 hypothetical protein COUCH_09835 [Couchioplanes caeruleus]
MDIPGRAVRACLALVLAGALTACRTEEPAVTHDRASTVYASVVTRIYGTPAQRRAADERAWKLTQIAAGECRRRAGIDYPARGFTPVSERTYVAPGDLLGFAPARADFDIAGQLELLVLKAVNAEHYARWMARTKRGSGPAWVAAQRCEATATATTARLAPEGQEHLAAALVAELSRVQAAAAPMLPADYRNCLHAQGFDAAGLPALQARVEQAFPAVPVGARTVPARLPGWPDAVTVERRAAAADARCRAREAGAVMEAALPRLTTFAATHTEALGEMSAGWSRIEVEARELRFPD